MKLYCVGHSVSSPCLVLQFKQTNIMLDCGLEMSTVNQFTPLSLVNNEKFSQLKSWSSRELQEIEGFTAQNNLKEAGGRLFIDAEPEVCPPETGLIDFSMVDVILISNYHHMLALPFITEYSGFNGKIYATEPTIQIGRDLMLELVTYAERVPKRRNGNMWKNNNVIRCLPAPLNELANVKSWRVLYRCWHSLHRALVCYCPFWLCCQIQAMEMDSAFFSGSLTSHNNSKHDVKACISKIQAVSYSEKLDLCGILQLSAHSSGFCLGSSNWMLESEYEKISYLSPSSSFTTHPLPLNQTVLKNSDVLIITGVTEAPIDNPDAMLGEFCTHLASTLRAGGNVLVPCYPSGVLYDLFECLYTYLDNAKLGMVPIYFISPVADSSLAYSNIYGEWLCQSKQTKVYLPEPPFPHAELLKEARLKVFSNLHNGFSSSFKTPCVVFTGHPSLRYGDAVHFMEIWGKSGNNTVIFTEPDFPYLEALAPYQPLAMKTCYCPIDPRLNFAQANKLLKELQPRHLVMPESYSRPPVIHPHRTDLTIEDPGCSLTTFNHLDVAALPISRSFEKVVIANELSSCLHPQHVRPGVAVATLTGTLVTKDNKYTLQPLEFLVEPKAGSEGGDSSTNKGQLSRHLWGTVQLDDFVRSLKKRGITDVNVESSGGEHTIHLPNDDAMILLDRGSTHIITHGNEELRIRIRDALLECVPQF